MAVGETPNVHPAEVRPEGSRTTRIDSSGAKLYTIGDIARMVGYSPATIRLWERQGLLSPSRSTGGYRLYTDQDVDRLRRIAYLRNVDQLGPAAIRRVFDAEGGTEQRAAAPTRDSDPVLPAQLRQLRKARGLTLEQVAASTGLSVSFVSSLERGETAISVATITRLLSSYGTTMGALLNARQRGRNGRLTRAGKGAKVADRYSKVVIHHLANGQIAMEPQLFEVEPGGGSGGGYAHAGEEFIYVLEGTFEVTLAGGERYHLQAGDTLYYPSTLEHSWRNPGEETARLLWVNTPPTF